ncbi:MAG: UPF0146 family protein [Haloquadratum sp.]|nr:UPF0146 family protein [Haloferacaceae archaeon]MDR9445452.1 UPF0146 family protein [Haloquadratum sp.]
MSRPTSAGLTALLADAQRVTEVAIGGDDTVAVALLARGVAVYATDVHPQPVDPRIQLVTDDLVAAAGRAEPGAVYASPVIYARRLPAELQRPLRRVAQTVGARWLFTTCGFEEPILRTHRRRLADGTVVHTAPDG